MLFAHDSVIDSVHALLSIARETLLREGSHLPTAILHTMEGLFPIVLPFKDDDQKKALMEVVKKQAIEQHAFAVTAISCGRIIDSRTGAEEECLVVATAIQGGSPHVVVQSYVRGPDRHVLAFGEAVEGDAAAMPGQMMIIPPWEQETRH